MYVSTIKSVEHVKEVLVVDTLVPLTVRDG